MSEKYFGLENEFYTWKNNEKVDFNDYFKSDFQEEEDYFKEGVISHVIRDINGVVYYVDINEFEINTPPIVINKGFSSRLADSLTIGRNRLLDFSEENGLLNTEYSMHWNISRDSNKIDGVALKSYYEGISIPFKMFATTPLSSAINLRNKSLNRYELLGDALINKDQVQAAALLFASYTLAYEEEKKSPFILSDERFIVNSKKKELIPDGRFDYINTEIATKNSKFKGEMQVQQYLETFYKWCYPYVKILGTKKERDNLEAYIFNDKKTEMDKFHKYSVIKSNSFEENGKYLPKVIDNENQTILKREIIDELPLENRLLGYLTKNKDYFGITGWDWDSLRFSLSELNDKIKIYRLQHLDYQSSDETIIEKINEISYLNHNLEVNLISIDMIYSFAEIFSDSNEKISMMSFNNSINKLLPEIKLKEPIVYDLKEDLLEFDKLPNFEKYKSLIGKELSTSVKETGITLKNIFTKHIGNKLAVLFFGAASIFFTGHGLNIYYNIKYKSPYNNMEGNKIIKEINEDWLNDKNFYDMNNSKILIQELNSLDNNLDKNNSENNIDLESILDDFLENKNDNN